MVTSEFTLKINLTINCTTRTGTPMPLVLNASEIPDISILDRLSRKSTDLRHLSEISGVSRNMRNDGKIYNSRLKKVAKDLKGPRPPPPIKVTPVEKTRNFE